ncbi:MAG: hypothetical protein EKK57_03815 [Proteobacteria bacterium]|nr:MAG: hypothetical protein EKK57_03815 [Pseudomonadota bacterium]
MTTTIIPKLSSLVHKREQFLSEKFRENLYNKAQKERVLNLLYEMRQRYGYTVTTTHAENGTWETITGNGKYSLD